MKQRILLIVAMLLIATPAFATVKIDVTQGTGTDVNKLTVSYNCTASEKVRAFALNFSFGSVGNSMTFSANPNDINDFNRGESNHPGGGYGIFPGQFRNRIDPANPNWFNLYYTPIAPDNDVDSNDQGLGNRRLIAELGTLYKDANAPGASGILFTVRVDANGKDCNVLTVSANTLRGGIVLESGATATDTNLPFTKTICLVPPATCTCPGNVAGGTPQSLPPNGQIDSTDAVTIIQWLQAYGVKSKITCPWTPPGWTANGCACPGNVAGGTPQSLPPNGQIDSTDAVTIIQWLQAYGVKSKITCPWTPPGWTP
jgi:hypothetical protein